MIMGNRPGGIGIGKARGRETSRAAARRSAAIDNKARLLAGEVLVKPQSILSGQDISILHDTG